MGIFKSWFCRYIIVTMKYHIHLVEVHYRQGTVGLTFWHRKVDSWWGFAIYMENLLYTSKSGQGAANLLCLWKYHRQTKTVKCKARAYVQCANVQCTIKLVLSVCTSRWRKREKTRKGGFKTLRKGKVENLANYKPLLLDSKLLLRDLTLMRQE